MRETVFVRAGHFDIKAAKPAFASLDLILCEILHVPQTSPSWAFSQQEVNHGGPELM